MQVLLTLAENPREVVTKDKIFRKVWPETFVGDEVLTRSVSELRKVFEDNPRQPAYIQTISKGGYRLVAPVVRLTPENAPILRGHRSEGKKWLLLTTLAIPLLGIVAFHFLAGKMHTNAQIRSIAVLPLSNLSGDGSQDYLADGMTDELTTRLSNISALRVISRTSAMHYKGSSKTTPEIARELNVDALLEGSVLRSGNKVRISAQLIQARDDKNVWAESYERELHDVLGLQADVARAVATEIRIHVTPQESEKVFAARVVNPEAHDLYLKGNYSWQKFTAAGMTTAISYYQRAIAIEPNYALAYAGLADAYHELWDVPPKEAIPKSRAASEKALQLDESLPEAHRSLGWVKWIYYWDWAGAEKEFQRALQLNPNSSVAHGMRAEYLDSLGRFAEAAKEHGIAIQLDPAEPIGYQNTGEHFLYTREFDKAIEQYNEALALDPTFLLAHAGLSEAYALKGMQNEAVEQLEEMMASEGDAGLATRMRAARAKSGYRGAIRILLEDLRVRRSKGIWLPPTDDAYFYLMLGEKSRALSALELAVEERDPNVTALQVDPVYDSIRSDPRFQKLLRRVGLPQ